MVSETCWTIEKIAALLAIISIIGVWLSGLFVFFKRKRQDYKQNKNKLPHLVKSFNLNQIKCLQQNNIIKLKSLDLNNLIELFNNTNINKIIFNKCHGSYVSLEEIVDVNKKIHSYKKTITILTTISIIILIIAIYFLSI